MTANWIEAPISDFINFRNGKTSPDRFDEGSLSVYGSNGIIGFCDKANAEERSLIVGRVGSYCGSVYHSYKKCWVTDNAIIGTPVNESESEFWYFLLTKLELNNYRAGSGQPLLNQGILNSIKVHIPKCSTTRQRIGQFLMLLDDKIEANRQINQTLEQIAQTIFKSWFVDFEPVKAKIEAKAVGSDPERAAMCAISGKLEPELDQFSPEQRQQLAATAALFPDELVESELGLIPKGWEASVIGRYANFQNGYAFKSTDWVESGFPVVKIGSVKPGLVDLSGCSFVDTETVVGLEAYQLSAGDLLVGMTGYPGETGLVPINDLPPYLNQRVGRVSPFPDKTKYFTWIHACLRWPGFKIFAENSAHGSAQANISGKLLMDYPVCFPGEPLVVTYHETFNSFVELFLRNSEQISKLSAIRDSLLPRLLNGEIDVRTLLPDA